MEFSLQEAVLKSLSIHLIGNKGLGEDLQLSDQEIQPEKEVAEKLKNLLLQRFANTFEQYHFSHSNSLKFNEVYNYVSDIFSDELSINAHAQKIAQHLYENSVHPKIKKGEIYIAVFHNCEWEGKKTQAVGIFKTENRSAFAELEHKKGSYNILYKEGIELQKFEKGCIVFNTNKKDGFEVLLIDQHNRAEEAVYWRELFLGVDQRSNNYQQTQQILSITKNYVTEQFEEEFEVNKTDKIELLNRSVEYFKTHDSFDKKEFEKEVFQFENVIQSFQNFDNSYRENYELDALDQFEISQQAVKKQARVFKSVLKLDKNFHIYIHGNRGLIEQGKDQDGRKYYKIYYDQES